MRAPHVRVWRSMPSLLRMAGHMHAAQGVVGDRQRANLAKQHPAQQTRPRQPCCACCARCTHLVDAERLPLHHALQSRDLLGLRSQAGVHLRCGRCCACCARRASGRRLRLLAIIGKQRACR